MQAQVQSQSPSQSQGPGQSRQEREQQASVQLERAKVVTLREYWLKPEDMLHRFIMMEHCFDTMMHLISKWFSSGSVALKS